ncbi:hypothetical protein MASR2M79_09500 [Aminivibrio sp.]
MDYPEKRAEKSHLGHCKAQPLDKGGYEGGKKGSVEIVEKMPCGEQGEFKSGGAGTQGGVNFFMHGKGSLLEIIVYTK